MTGVVVIGSGIDGLKCAALLANNCLKARSSVPVVAAACLQASEDGPHCSNVMSGSCSLADQYRI